MFWDSLGCGLFFVFIFDVVYGYNNFIIFVKFNSNERVRILRILEIRFLELNFFKK